MTNPLAQHWRTLRRVALPGVALTLAAPCSPGSTQPVVPTELIPSATNMIAVRDVTVLPMTGAPAASHRTVFVVNGKITRIDPATAPIEAAYSVVDGTARYLMPGLIDAHVHLRRADAPQYVADGVLTVRNMWGHSGIRPLVKDIEQGVLIGPATVSLSPGIDGSPPQWPETQILGSASGADTLVRRLVGDGWTTLKVYQSLSLSSFDAIVAAAAREHVAFAGHVPSAVPIEHALQSGMKSIEHFTGYDKAFSVSHNLGTWGWSDADLSGAAPLVAMTVARGVWNVPTLSIYRTLAQQHSASMRQRVIDNRRQFVRMLSDAGAHIAAGTDAGIDVIPAAGALLGELQELEAAGLTRDKVLQIATRENGLLLGIAGLGTIAVNAPARLLLLDADPTKDLTALRTMRAAVLDGTLYTVSPACFAGPALRTSGSAIKTVALNCAASASDVPRGNTSSGITATSNLTTSNASTNNASLQKPSVAGTYDTKVSVASGNCTMGVENNPTVVQELSNGTVVTLAHAGTTYGGALKPDRSFVTQLKQVTVGSVTYSMTVAGTFRGDTLNASVSIDYGQNPACHVVVKWAGIRETTR